MHRALAPILALVAVLACAARAAESADAKPRPAAEIERLVKELSSEDWQARHRATERLAAIGTPAVRRLRRALHSKDHEVRHRAEMILNRIAAKSAWNRLAREKLSRDITLELSRAPLAAALKAFERASGVEVAMSPHLEAVAEERKILVSIAAHGIGARQILARILKPHGLTYDLVYDSAVVEGGSELAPLVIEKALSAKVGPFDFEEAPLRDAVGKLRAQLPVEVVFDAKAFADGGGAERLVTLETNRKLSARTVLSLVLAGHELGYVYDARRIIVTTRERKRDRAVTRSHDISALAGHLDLVAGVREAERKVLEAARGCINAVGWSGAGSGGRNTIKLDGQALAVKAPPATQERIEEFLRRLAAAVGVSEPEKPDEEEDFF